MHSDTFEKMPLKELHVWGEGGGVQMFWSEEEDICLNLSWRYQKI